MGLFVFDMVLSFSLVEDRMAIRWYMIIHWIKPIVEVEKIIRVGLDRARTGVNHRYR
jgi:hypothetical protein